VLLIVHTGKENLEEDAGKLLIYNKNNI